MTESPHAAQVTMITPALHTHKHGCLILEVALAWRRPQDDLPYRHTVHIDGLPMRRPRKRRNGRYWYRITQADIDAVLEPVVQFCEAEGLSLDPISLAQAWSAFFHRKGFIIEPMPARYKRAT